MKSNRLLVGVVVTVLVIKLAICYILLQNGVPFWILLLG